MWEPRIPNGPILNGDASIGQKYRGKATVNRGTEKVFIRNCNFRKIRPRLFSERNLANEAL